MNWNDLFAAIALLCVIEGLFPFFNPTKWRAVMKTVLMQNDVALRLMGLSFMILGVVVLYVVRGE